MEGEARGIICYKRESLPGFGPGNKALNPQRERQREKERARERESRAALY